MTSRQKNRVETALVVVWTILILVLARLFILNCHAQISYVPSLLGTWEPRNIVTKAGLVASYDPGNTATETFNPAGYAAGNGVSQILDRAMSIRTGNLLLQSETFATTWTLTHCNAFGATDTGATGAGSFANTTRTLDPLGGNTADFIQEDAVGNNSHFVAHPAIATTATPYTFSAFVKRDTTGILTNVMLYDSVSGVGKGFDLVSATPVAVSGITAPTSASMVTDAGWQGFYKCSITFTAVATAACRVQTLTNSAGIYVSNYIGDGTKGFFLWGASLVKSDWTPVTGPTLATGYQVTTTAAYAPPDLAQGTAANQPKISRTDGAGNLLLQSETFATTWTLTRCKPWGVTDDGLTNSGSFANTTRTTDPLGGNTADFIQEDDTAGNTHYINIAAVSIAFPVGTHTFTCWIKPSGRNDVRLRVFDGTTSAYGYFNVATGTAGATTGTTMVSASTSIVGSPINGWYLCALTFTTANAATSASVYIYLADSTPNNSYNGDGTKGIFLWGASLVKSDWTPVTGATAALGYVATTTVPIFPGLAGRAVQYYDGAAYYMKTAAFPLVQPCEIYSLANPWTWTLNDAMFDGYALNSGKLYQSATTPNIRYTAGTVGTELAAPPAGTWRVSSVVFDGASSRISTNSGAFVVSDAGVGSMNGFTLGAAGTVGTTFWNGLRGRELITSKTNAAAEANYLRWGLLKQASLY